MLLTSGLLGLLTVVLPVDGRTDECRAHFVNEDRTREYAVDCGRREEIPEELSLVWIERENSITPYQRRVTEKEITLPLASGAILAVDEAVPDARRTLAIVHVDKQAMFVRNVIPGVPFLIPRGTLILLSRDENDNLLAVSRPLEIRDSPTEVVRTAVAAEGTVYVELSWPDSDAPDNLKMSIDVGGHVIEPSLTLRRLGGVTGVWFGVTARAATLEVRGTTLWNKPVELAIRPRQVTEVRSRLQPLPAITVMTEAASEEISAIVAKGRLLLQDAEGKRTLREVAMTRTNERHVVGLEPAIYTVRLELADWTLTRRADLTDGENARVVFDVRPLTINGAITRGGKPLRARIAVRGGVNEAAAVTDALGQYTLLVWQQGRYQAEISAVDSPAAPHIEMVNLQEDRTLDWDLPSNEYVIRVVEASSRKPIAGSQVSVSTTWHDGAGERQSMRTLTADGDGVVTLPPLYPGSLTLIPSASGYDVGSPTTIPIPKGRRDRTTLTLELQREKPGARHMIRLADGAPAVGAEVLGLASIQKNAVWRGVVDETGAVSIPAGIPILAVRHPRAAIMVYAAPGEDVLPWTLPPPAPPLTIHAVNRQDQEVRGAPVTLWLNGFRVSGPFLGYLTSSVPLTDGNGVWIGRNLPAQAIQVLLVAPSVGFAISEGGSYDRMASTLQFPWRAVETVRVIE